MRLLVTGANGQLGWELARSLMPLGEVTALNRQACDLARPETLDAIIAAHAPDVIVNAAAYTAVDRAESEAELAMVVNGESVGVLATAAKRRGALFLHYSTDYVFDGSKPSPYLETDAVAPINTYGSSKLAGERAIAAVGGDYLVFRTTWVYAARGGNFVRTMLRLGAERSRLGVVADQFGAPTWARNLADATALIVLQARQELQHGDFQSGLYHMSAQGRTSWHEYAETVFELARTLLPAGALCVDGVDAIGSDAYPTPAARPKNSVLAGDALQRRFAVRLPHWQHALRYCMQEIGSQN